MIRRLEVLLWRWLAWVVAGQEAAGGVYWSCALWAGMLSCVCCGATLRARASCRAELWCQRLLSWQRGVVNGV